MYSLSDNLGHRVIDLATLLDGTKSCWRFKARGYSFRLGQVKLADLAEVFLIKDRREVRRISVAGLADVCSSLPPLKTWQIAHLQEQAPLTATNYMLAFVPPHSLVHVNPKCGRSVRQA